VMTGAFITLQMGAIAAVIVFQIVSVHLVPHATDIGVSATVSAAALGLTGGISIPGRIGGGALSDRLGWQRILALSVFAMAGAIVFLIYVRSVWMLYVFVLVYGLGYGARTSCQMGLLGNFFGMKPLGNLIGISAGVSQGVAAFSPFIAGFVFDRTGSYSIVFLIGGALLLITGVMIAVMKRPMPVEA
jgi:MFS family permease